MSVAVRPIPAFYAVYVLRSTVRHASLYIGSTPHPPRRLKQHNGESKGGARRTSRQALRPWEMITLVSGFPSAIAALKFEWALNNAHLTLHIPPEARLTQSPKRKGRPRRPKATTKSIIANIHLLVGVSSFARWPLNVHFLAPEARRAWDDRVQESGLPARPGLRVLTDFTGGIHDLVLDYSDIGAYVQKAKEVVEFEREGRCVHCDRGLEPGKGLYPMCPNEGCEAMGHLECWSKHALGSEADEAGGAGGSGAAKILIPNGCECLSCGKGIRWGDMMKELSLRVRGPDEVEKVLKRRQRARRAAERATQKVEEEKKKEEEEEEEEEEEKESEKESEEEEEEEAKGKGGGRGKAKAKATAKGKGKGRGKAKAT